jgi:hypothetical protein
MLKFSSDGYGIHTVKGKVHPTTGHKDLEGEERYSSTLSLISAPDGGGDIHIACNNIHFMNLY